MPTYEYHCTKCDKTFDYQQKMSDAPLTDCLDAECGGQGTLKRLIGAGVGLIFKGSGFYITDYKNGGSKEGKSESSTAGTEAKNEAKAESKAEVKTETKSESKDTGGASAATGKTEKPSGGS